MISLRDVCFDLKSPEGKNLFVDISNATRSGTTVFQVKREDKSPSDEHYKKLDK